MLSRSSPSRSRRARGAPCSSPPAPAAQHRVAQRRRELGVRLALGAQRGDVLSLVLRSGVRLAAIGIVIGLVGGLALSQSLAALLYGVTPRDLTTFTVVPVILGVVTLVATYVPARRATKVDPLVAIRAGQ